MYIQAKIIFLIIFEVSEAAFVGYADVSSHVSSHNQLFSYFLSRPAYFTGVLITSSFILFICLNFLLTLSFNFSFFMRKYNAAILSEQR